MTSGSACTDWVACAVGGVQNTVNGVAGAVSYWSDPWGNTYKALRDAANGLAGQLLPQLTSATLPDLSLDWFVGAYRVSFAAAIFGAVLLLIPQILRTARGLQSGREVLESIGLFFPLFLIGAMFGPAIGLLLVNFFHALSTSLSTWGISSSLDVVNKRFSEMLSEKDPLAIAGGVPVATLLMLLMLCGLFFVLLVLVVQLVTLYFVGVLIPLSLLWIIDPQRRAFGMRLVGLWVGVLAAHPLLFFLLGVAFNMLGGSINFLGNDASLQKLVQLLAAVIAMFIAAASPLLLMKFAPVIPVGFGGTQGPSVQPGSWGPNSMSEALDRYRSKADDSGTSSGQANFNPSGGFGSGASSGGSSGGGGSLSSAAASRAGASPGVGTAGGGAAGGGVAVEGLVGAGTAESATGVGAAIGVPTLIAAGAMMAGSVAVGVAQTASDHAVATMDSPGEGEA
jgi:type IV secretion system protein TrbL